MNIPPAPPKTPPPVPGFFEGIFIRIKTEFPLWIRSFFRFLHLDKLPGAIAWLIVLSLIAGPVLFVSVVHAAFTATPIQKIITPSATWTATFTEIPTNTPTLEFTATFTIVPTETLTPTITLTPTGTITPTITLTVTPTFTPTVTLPPIDAVAACINPENLRQVGTVTRIVDGDTIVVLIDGKSYKVRYIGMDAPEVGSTGASAATNLNSSLVMGKVITLVKDVSEVDRYDRLLRYVFVDDLFVNYELVKNGLARAGSWPPDTACDAVIAAAQSSAQMGLLGLWRPTSTPMPYVPPAATQAPVNGFVGSEPTKGNCDPSYPTVCIPPPPPDLDCKDIPYRRFKVLSPDPHHFDGDHDGIGCES